MTYHKTRKYRGVEIHYDPEGRYNPAYSGKTYHWYVEVTHAIANDRSKVVNEYFATIRQAEQFIRSFGE